MLPEFTNNVELVIFSQSLSVDSIAEIEDSNKIILGKDILEEICKQEYPETMIFTLTNITEFGVYNKTVAVHDFTAPPGTVYLPTKIAEELFVERGGTILINHQSVPNGEFIKIKPLSPNFYDLDNVKELFEKTINKYYPVLTVGDEISLMGTSITVKITECRPGDSISTIDTNLNVDFEAPDFDIPRVETTEDILAKIKKYTTGSESKNETVEELDSGEFVPFSGTGHTLGTQ